MSGDRSTKHDAPPGALPPFARLFDRAADIVSVHRGADHHYVYTNPAGAARIGSDPVGRTFAETWPHLAEQGFAARYDAVYESGEAEVFPAANAAPARDLVGPNAPRWVRHTIAPWMGADGAIAGVISTVQDVSDAHEATERAREREVQRDLGLDALGAAGTWEVLLADRSCRFDPSLARLLGVPSGTDLASVPPEIADRGIDPRDRKAVAAAFERAAQREEDFAVEYRATGTDGTTRWLLSRGRCYREREGGPVTHLAGIAVDITGRIAREDEVARLASESRVFRALAESSPDFIGIANQDLVSIFVNPAGRALVGRGEEEAEATSIRDYFVPEERAFLEEVVLPTVEATGRWEGPMHMTDLATGRAVPILYSHFLIVDPDTGEATHHATISRDLTQQRRDEAHRQLLIDELNHRVKNTMAVVQAVASQTFRDVPSAAVAVDKFRGRLSALSGAHEVLTVERWQTADLRRTLVRALDGGGVPAERVTIGGPDASLPGKLAVSLVMAIHELCTNAAKHGALSADEGDISLGWTIEPGTPRRLRIVWRERGGPAVTGPPSRTGFGMLMIERSLAAEAKGEVRMDWAPAGLTCTISAILRPSPEEKDADQAG